MPNVRKPCRLLSADASPTGQSRAHSRQQRGPHGKHRPSRIRHDCEGCADGLYRGVHHPVQEILGGEAVNRIRVTLSLQGVDVIAAQSPELTRCWSTAYVDYTFRMRSRTNIAVAIRILETNMGAPRAKSTVQEQIQRQLLGSRYSIVEDSKALSGLTPGRIQEVLASGEYNELVAALGKHADVAILGEVSTAQRSNPFPQMYFSSGRAIVRVIDCRRACSWGMSTLKTGKREALHTSMPETSCSTRWARAWRIRHQGNEESA